MNQNTKMLLGAVIAAALAIAVYYGAISQNTANNIQTQTNRTLGTGPVAQQPGTTNAAAPGTSAAAPTTPAAAPATPTGTSSTPTGAPAAPAPVPPSQNATAPAQPK